MQKNQCRAMSFCERFAQDDTDTPVILSETESCRRIAMLNIFSFSDLNSIATKVPVAANNTFKETLIK